MPDNPFAVPPQGIQPPQGIPPGGQMKAMAIMAAKLAEMETRMKAVENFLSAGEQSPPETQIPPTE